MKLKDMPEGSVERAAFCWKALDQVMKFPNSATKTVGALSENFTSPDSLLKAFLKITALGGKQENAGSKVAAACDEEVDSGKSYSGSLSDEE